MQYFKGTRSPVRGRFHLDQCACHRQLARMLAEQGFEVSLSSKLGMALASDAEQLAYAAARRGVLITFNWGDFARLASTQPHAGVLVSIQAKSAYQEILRLCILLSEGRL